MSTLQLYSTLGKSVRTFEPVVPGEVRMYVCGVTPYDVTHLGHAFSYVQFDTLRRYLQIQRLPGEVRPERHRHRRRHDQGLEAAGRPADPGDPRREPAPSSATTSIA